MAAVVVLDSVTVEREHSGGYRRELFPTWLLVDARPCTARELVLLRESTSPLGDGTSGCSLGSGAWVSPYDGEAINDPGNAEIDHVVSVKEAWDSGAWAWTDERRAAFANDVTDPRTLHAVTPSANRAKGDKDPSNWLPERADFVCGYLAEWLSIKARWELTMDESEAGRIRGLLTRECPGAEVAPWSPAPERLLAAPSTAPTRPTEAIAPPTIQPLVAPTATVTGPTNPPADVDVTPGAFCSAVGATGTHAGRTYVCDRYSQTGSSYKGDRPHWRPV